MEQTINHFIAVVITALGSPISLAVVVALAFAGEFGIAPPGVLDAALVAAGVGLAQGVLIALALLPLVMIGAVLGSAASYWLTQHGVRLFLRFARPPKWAGTSNVLTSLTSATPFTVAFLRQLPGSQLPLTAIWSAMRGRLRPLLEGVGLSALIHGVVVVAIGAVSAWLLGPGFEGSAFFLAFVISLAIGFGLAAVAHLVQRRRVRSQGKKE